MNVKSPSHPSPHHLFWFSRAMVDIKNIYFTRQHEAHKQKPQQKACTYSTYHSTKSPLFQKENISCKMCIGRFGTSSAPFLPQSKLATTMVWQRDEKSK